MITGFEASKSFKLTIDYTKVGTEDLTNFPLAINLNAQSGITHVSCSGIFTELYTTFPTVDPYWSSVLIAMPMDNVAGATNFRNIAKTSGYTVGGNATMSASSYKYGVSSLYLDGVGDYVKAPLDQSIGFRDFTFECWLNPTMAAMASSAVIFQIGANTTSGTLVIARNGTSNPMTLNAQVYTSAYNYVVANNAITVPASQWTHLAVVRQNGVWNMYIGGQQVTTSGITNTMDLSQTSFYYIGADSAAAAGYNGYIDDLKLTAGVARYTENFTPSTYSVYETSPNNAYENPPLKMAVEYYGFDTHTTTADSYTSLLISPGTTASGVIKDDSLNNFTLTPTGSPTITGSITKFNNQSLYLNGSSYLSIPISTAFSVNQGEEFTFDWWQYCTAINLSGAVFSSKNGVSYIGLLLGYVSTGGAIQAYSSSNGTSWDILNGFSLGTMVLNTWEHYTVTRKAGYFYGYKNGILINKSAYSALNPKYEGEAAVIGAYSTYKFGGYLSEIRFSKGITRWGDDFTVASGTYIQTKVAPPMQQCYTEITYWDQTNYRGQLYTRVPKISCTRNTILYLYYDRNATNNTVYVGKTGSSAAQTVWDSNYFAVYHSNQIPCGTNSLLDSTSNLRHGTTYANMSKTNLINCFGSKTLNFNGTSEYAKLPFTAMPVGSITVQAVVCSNVGTDVMFFDNQRSGQYYPSYSLRVISSLLNWIIYYSAGANYSISSAESVPTGTYMIATARQKSGYANVQYNAATTQSVAATNNAQNINNYFYLALTDSTTTPVYYNVQIGALFISNISRSGSWVDTGYNAIIDELIAFENIQFTYTGFVTLNDYPVSRTVNLYERTTYNLVGSTVSDAVTGAFSINSPFSGLHFVVILPEVGDGYNMLSYDQITPSV